MLYAVKESTLNAMGDAVRTYKLGQVEIPHYEECLTMKYENNAGDGVKYKMYDNFNDISSKTKIIIKSITNSYYGDEYSDSRYGKVGIIVGWPYNVVFPSSTDIDVYVPKDATFPFETIIDDSIFYLYYESTVNNVWVDVDIEFIPMKDDGEEFKYTPAEMVEEVNNLAEEYQNAAILDDEDLVISGDCRYRFAYQSWNWFIEKYGNKITTNDITMCSYMFNDAYLKEIPFDINARWYENSDMNYMFYRNDIQTPPRIDKIKPSTMGNLFGYCKCLKSIPEDWCDNWDWSYLEGLTSSYSGNQSYLFANCNSLRSYPNSILSHGNPVVSYNNSIYNALFNGCFVLDEVIDLPFPHYNASWTTNAFGSIFNYCYRLKNMTFKLQDDGTPYVMKWKNQTIDLSNYVGYHTIMTPITNNKAYHGITADKAVFDDATYQALKDDADWFAMNIDYSRYNHDSAVATINSLPDCSATGTNTIKFKGAAGAKTDGGAINTLTEEEIAVATAKGWTVSLV